VSSARKFAVYGNPIKHSKSPIIHSAFAAQFGHRIEYRAVRVELGDFERSARAFFERGGAGLNVTVPFKPDAAFFADRLSDRARRAGAANTLHPGEDEAILGDTAGGNGADGVNRSEISHDRNSRVVRVTDDNGNALLHWYDGANRRVATRDALGNEGREGGLLFAHESRSGACSPGAGL